MKQTHSSISHEQLKAKNNYSNRIDLLRNRVGMLAGKDKLLMTMYLENGNSFRQMARLVGVNEATIARRIRKVTKRLINNEYITCLRNRDKFTEAEMDIAKDHFLLGMSIRKIVKERHLSYYRIYQSLKKIQRFVKVTAANKKQFRSQPHKT